MKRLLVATDLSGRSKRAIERAVALAREQNAVLVVVHVVDEDLPPPLAEAQAATAQEGLNNDCEALAGSDGPEVIVEVIRGQAHADIQAAAVRHNAELVVLGRHRSDLWRDIFRGTTAERIIRTCSMPVLLVRDPANGPYRRVLAAVDFSGFARRAVEFAVRFVPAGEIELIHAYHVPFEGFLKGQDTRDQMVAQIEARFRKLLDDEMAAFLRSLETTSPRLTCVMQEGTVHEVVLARVAQTSPDLLVIGTHGKTGLAHAVLGSVAEDLLRSPPCDVLIVGAW